MRYFIFLMLFCTNALAFKIEPGSLLGFGGVGAGLKMGNALGGSNAYFLLDGGVEYAIDSNFSVLGELTLGIADTVPWRWRAGGRYRFTGLEGPFSPYVQAQLSNGVVFDIIGANLWVLGVRLGGGVDYYLTKDIGIGTNLNFDLGSTLHKDSAFYGTTEWLVYATYRLK